MAAREQRDHERFGDMIRADKDAAHLALDGVRVKAKALEFGGRRRRALAGGGRRWSVQMSLRVRRS